MERQKLEGETVARRVTKKPALKVNKETSAEKVKSAKKSVKAGKGWAKAKVAAKTKKVGGKNEKGKSGKSK